jgi:hypothetical protein
MPDTKRGRERKGKNKRLQRVERLYAKELERLDGDDPLPEFDGADADLVADEPAAVED